MPAPRSLADDLRTRDDRALAALVAARPDLAHPVPADLTALAARAGSPASVAAALRGLDQLCLHIVLAAALGPDPISGAGLVAAVAEPLRRAIPQREARGRVRAGVERLTSLALLWGTDRALHLAGAARDLVVPADRGPRVAALDPVVAGYAGDPDSLTRLIESAPDGARAAVDRLLAGPVIGTVVDARREPVPTRSPVDWLLAHHVLLPLGRDRAVLPAEVVALLRGQPVPAAVPLNPPQPAGAVPEPTRVEHGAVGAVLEVLHGLSELGAAWADAPPSRLRSGGLAQRDLTRTARALGRTEATTALLIEAGTAAGLLAADSHELRTVLPTPAFDTWLGQEPAERHAALLVGWLDMPRRIRPDAPRALDPDATHPGMAELRREVLAALASGAGGWTDDEVLAALDWWAPRRAEPSRGERAREVLAELRTLGLLVAGTLTSAGRALVADDRTTLLGVLAAVLPGQVDALVLQADLTAVVPGLPTPELAALMRLVAQPESTGAASVYRFSADSIRRALDAGWTSGGLLAELGRRGSVPQPLAYLVEDVARRHATLRIGAVATYLRCDDRVALAAILADPAVAGLGLFALSDTVLASAHPPEHVLDRLRQSGHHPQPEHGMGPLRPGPRRAHSRAATEPTVPRMTQALAAAAVRAMRAGEPGAAGGASRTGAGRAPRDRGTAARAGRVLRDPATQLPRHPVDTQAPSAVMTLLRSAIAAESTVWIGYADPSGVAGDRRVEPLRLAGGYLTALDLRTETVQSFAVARITGVQPG